MGKLVLPPNARLKAVERKRRRELRAERRELAERLQKLDAALAKLTRPIESGRPPTPERFDRWFDEMGQGLPDLPPLPSDFSRADLYDDHN